VAVGIFKTERKDRMIKTTLTVRCVLGHEQEIEDDDGAIRLQGYTRCSESGCKRNAFTVNVRTEDDGQQDLKAWRVKIPDKTIDDMKHLDAPAVCPHCGESLE